VTIEQFISERRERMRNMTAYYRSLDFDGATESGKTERRSPFSFHTPCAELNPRPYRNLTT